VFALANPNAQNKIMKTSNTPKGSMSANDPSRFFDDEERDLIEYLKEEGDTPQEHVRKAGFAALFVGAVGVVYGDIGTSPIYAFREALKAVSGDGATMPEVLGLLSILIWTLILIVTLKYVAVLLRADNRGEGGILAIYTLVRLAIGHWSLPVLLLAIAGAALFAGDAIITPAISVLSAVEGAGLILPALSAWVMPATLVILTVLFAVQSRGTAVISAAFGPITLVWFLALAGLGVWHIVATPQVLAAFNPLWAVSFLTDHAGIAFLVMGAVFLAVTGAEALYADLGHFGRRPIVAAWLVLVFPALVLNYLGQGALVLRDPAALSDPFFRMASESLLPFLVLLATAATVIASQAVISGAFSMARGAIQLGLLPRLRIRHTSADQSGQIYIGTINWMLLIGVVWLVVSFKSSGALASAYGIAVTGTMVTTTVLGLLYVVNSGRMSLPLALVLVAPVGTLELIFLASNLSKIHDGGYVPVLIALALGVVMWAWWRGTQQTLAASQRTKIALDSFVAQMEQSSAHVIPGTAFFLTPDPDVVPSALLHNLKHNRVRHEQTVLLTVETLRVPLATPDERISLEQMTPGFVRLIVRFGFMETPNVSRALGLARRAGLKFDVMTTTFFLGRRRFVVVGPFGIGRIFDQIYAFLSRLSADPTEYYHLPRNRVVELGERTAL
jgi:KUP system potassium uptake protein